MQSGFGSAGKSPWGSLLRAALIGVVAGSRSQLPLALLSLAARQGLLARRSGWLVGRLYSPASLAATGILAAGEFLGDKLPAAPDRIAPLPLAGRLIIGGLSGGLLQQATGHSAIAGGAVGAAGALAGSYAGYHSRRFLGKKTNLPDPLWGAVEDSLALSLGLLALPRSAR